MTDNNFRRQRGKIEQLGREDRKEENRGFAEPYSVKNRKGVIRLSMVEMKSMLVH